MQAESGAQAKRSGRWRTGQACLVAAGLSVVAVLGNEPHTAAQPPVAEPAARSEQAGSLEQTQHMVEGFHARFRVIGPALAEQLDQLYADDVRFRDPISSVTGLAALRLYFARFAEVSQGARFEITDEVVQPGQAAVFWTMTIAGKDGKPGRQFGGVSHLKVRDRIYDERDYFDLGEAVYDHVPVLSWLTRLVKSYLD
jgi:ketosteroid isomerase-like protein